VFPLLIALLSAPSPADEGGAWSDFAEAFPVLPCADGWAGCVVGTSTVSPEPLDDGGAPTPSDLRVGWFSLGAQPTFDPFPELSVYRGPASRQDRPAPEPPAQTDCADGSAPPCDLDDDPEVVAVLDPTERPDEPDPPEGDVDDDTEADGTPDGVPLARLDEQPLGQADDDPVVPANPTDISACGDPSSIEREAMMGRLSGTHRACLESVVASVGNRITARSKANRPLMVNAWYSGDKVEWERLVVRHLDEIERSDPAIALKYASHLARAGRPAPAVIRWADVALENRHLWQRDEYVRNTLKLRGLKARAAGRQWQALEEAKADGKPVDDGARRKWRTDTVTFAREWWEYSESVGKPSKLALSLCISAAGTEDACR